MTEKDELLIKVQHYNQSFEIIRENEKQRNKFFVFLSISTFLLTILIISPSDIFQVFNSIKFGNVNLILENANIKVIWFFLSASTFYLNLRYYQSVFLVKRLYRHLKNIENSEVDSKFSYIFEREGVHYKSNYYRTSKMIGFSYLYIFPLSLLLTNICIINSIIKIWDFAKMNTLLYLFPVLCVLLGIIQLSETLCRKSSK